MTFTVGPNQQVVVSGVPTLLLGDGGVAVYSAAVSTIATQRVFVYVVGSQQITSDLKVVGLTLNGGSVSAPGSQFLGPATPVAARLNFTTGSQPESVAGRRERRITSVALADVLVRSGDAALGL